MKHFKSHNPGMSLLEVVGAIAILAIFGSSLFLMQQYLFDRMSISQYKMIARQRMQTEIVAVQTQIAKAVFAQEGSIEKILEEKIKDFAYPEMTIRTKSYADLAGKDDQKESSFKKCKDLCLISVHAKDFDTDLGSLYAFVYSPKDQKK